MASSTLLRLTFTTADGTEHELVDLNSGGQPHVTGPNPCPNPPNYSRGTTFVSNDGSAMTFISDTACSTAYHLVLPEGQRCAYVSKWQKLSYR